MTDVTRQKQPVKLRLFILADTAAPHTRRWARWFARRGHDVHVGSLNPNGLPGYEPATVHHIWEPIFGNALPERALKAPVVMARLRSALRRHRPHVLHAHSAGGYAWLAAFSGFKPYVVTPWGTDLLVDARKSRLNRMMTGYALRHASLVTTDGFHFVDILRDLGVSAAETLVHTFGVDVDYFSRGLDGGEREALGAHGGPIVISTRTPNPVHDVRAFVRAIPSIQREYPSATFVVVGDGTERAPLQAMAEASGVAAAVRFVGMVEEDRMRRLLRAADVYVSTSLMDAGLAGSTAEAMATALPVVQTDNSDNAFWTPDGEGGFLIPNSDDGALASSVCRLLGDSDLRARMGARNRSVIVERYNMDTEMTRVESEYVRLAGLC